MKILSPPFLILVTALSLAACAESDIQVYQAPKERSVTPTKTLASTAEAHVSAGLHWTVPRSWVTKQSSKMRIASYTAPSEFGDVDVSVIKLLGEAGGLAANVNRWRGQIGLSAQTDTEIRQEAKSFSLAGLPVITVYLKGDPNYILATTIIYQGESWFFKAVGPSKAVEAILPEFDRWVQGVHADD